MFHCEFQLLKDQDQDPDLYLDQDQEQDIEQNQAIDQDLDQDQDLFNETEFVLNMCFTQTPHR